MKIIIKIVKYVLAIVVIIPILFLGMFVFTDINQERGLKKLCANAKIDISIQEYLIDAENTKFKVLTGGPNGKNEDEWYDREYLRYGVRLRENKNIVDDYSIVFAKPGIGFYACIVIHRNGMITTAWFENHAN